MARTIARLSSISLEAQVEFRRMNQLFPFSRWSTRERERERERGNCTVELNNGLLQSLEIRNFWKLCQADVLINVVITYYLVPPSFSPFFVDGIALLLPNLANPSSKKFIWIFNRLSQLFFTSPSATFMEDQSPILNTLYSQPGEFKIQSERSGANFLDSRIFSEKETTYVTH